MRDQPEIPGLSLAALHVLREDQPSESELAAAYWRFARKTQHYPSGLIVSRWLLAGLVMGLGLAFGAEAAVKRFDQPLPAEQPAPLVVPHAAQKLAPLSVPQPRPASSPESPAQPPTPPSEPKGTRAASSAQPKLSPLETDERPPADSAVWTKAAQGLRDNDLAATQSALSTLEQAGSESDREAARLIRAQLMLHQGNTSGAQALLRDLAKNAQSSQVRAKARSLLTPGSTKSNSALNVAPSGP